MKHKNKCPECGGHDTERQWIESHTALIEEVRTCDCGAEYVNRYELAGKEVTHEPDD